MNALQLTRHTGNHYCRRCEGLAFESSLKLPACPKCGGFLRLHNLGIQTGHGSSDELRMYCECCSADGDGDGFPLSAAELQLLGYQLPNASSALEDLERAFGFIELVGTVTSSNTAISADLMSAARALKRAIEGIESLGPLQVQQHLDECEVLAHKLEIYRAEADKRLLAKELSTKVYFLSDSNAATVKIGFSKDVDSRIIALQTSNTNPLVLLGSIPGGRVTERVLHAKFRRFRIKGEWFTAAPELLQYIEAACAKQALLETL